MAHDFKSKNVQFYYVYKHLAHPGWSDYFSPLTIQERLLHIAEARRTLRTSIPWLCDKMDGSFAEVMGRAPNSEFIIGPDGRIVKRHGWNNVIRLREELESLVGPAETTTSPDKFALSDSVLAFTSELDSKSEQPRLERPDGMFGLKYELKAQTEHPYYAKLRAEVTSELLYTGQGKLYLGLFLDPVHQVHWNNLGNPVRIEIEGAEAVELESRSLEGPKLEVATDSAPREFLVDINNWGTDDQLDITVFYTACNDEAGWCKSVQQRYRLSCYTAEGARPIRLEHRDRMLKYLEYRDGAIPAPELTASPDQIKSLVGSWEMETYEDFRDSEWVLHFDYKDGVLSGWSTYNQAHPDLSILSFDGETIRLLQWAGPAPEEIVLAPDGRRLNGTHLSVFGDFEIEGKRKQ